MQLNELIQVLIRADDALTENALLVEQLQIERSQAVRSQRPLNLPLFVNILVYLSQNKGYVSIDAILANVRGDRDVVTETLNRLANLGLVSASGNRFSIGSLREPAQKWR